MKVLVIGSGGREHALCWAIAKSPDCDELYCAPGNAGIDQVAITVPIAVDDLDAIMDFVSENGVNFVVVGPEGPLVEGLVDRLEDAGVPAFGPNARAAEYEGSKGLTKDLCAKYLIPTADYARFDEPDAAKEYIRVQGAPIVVKADGLAAGKGVIMCRNVNEAYAAIDHIMTESAFGEAGAEVVIEEMMVGEEASFFALVDGKTALPLVAAQDHKAVFDGDDIGRTVLPIYRRHLSEITALRDMPEGDFLSRHGKIDNLHAAFNDEKYFSRCAVAVENLLAAGEAPPSAAFFKRCNRLVA